MVAQDRTIWALQDIFSATANAAGRPVVSAARSARTRYAIDDRGDAIFDEFADTSGARCCFLRSNRGLARNLSLSLQGDWRVQSCASGGWLLQSRLSGEPSYWIPQGPVARTLDRHARILSEEPATFAGLEASANGLGIEIAIAGDGQLDCVVWRFPAGATDLIAGLERPLTLELQPMFMLGSHTNFCGPADVYRYLVHGHVYENRFEWRYKWKVCAENEAYSLYLTLHGLELATGKRLYGLLKRQIVLSVISRQSEDGGWYHGEWSDFMESHYRLHNGAVLLLEAAFEEYGDDSIRTSLAKAAAFTARHTDNTALGLWFLHDSLEEDVDLLLKSGSRLIPSKLLGKSPGTKLILNTHLDSIVVLDRYREVTRESQYVDRVDSARTAMRRLLALRPAEALYRLVSWAVRLTLVPPSRAGQLPLPLRAVRRAVREHLLPRLHALKRRFPRMVMPSGLIERHLSMPHYDLNYQTVNLMDLLRVWRRFPDEDLDAIVKGAIAAVRETGLLETWTESKQRQGLGYWAEALYHLCMLSASREHRAALAEALLIAGDAGLGLPPSLLGANPEAVHLADRVPCPSPIDARLRVANLSCGRRSELLVINPSTATIALMWDSPPREGLAWTDTKGQPASASALGPRSWILGTSDAGRLG